MKCPICRHEAKLFLPFGRASTRENAKCPRCGSLERHRLLWLYLRRVAPIPDDAIVMHFAPERCLRRKLTGHKFDYITADIRGGRGMRKIDITDIPEMDDMYDVILCSHVLEHVADDHKAMSEITRVLTPSGFAVVTVPLFGGLACDDAVITDAEERARRYGQASHVRAYGLDFPDRFPGVDIAAIDATSFLSASEIAEFNPLDGYSGMYVVRK